MNRPLRFLGTDIVFQEVPDEITLAINISGCPYKCRGCHSSYLWEYRGILLKPALPQLLKKYRSYITCVCFMGGDQNMDELENLLLYVKSSGLRTCLYSGAETAKAFKNLLLILDYLKIGPYKEDRGGLNDPDTNQSFYIVNDCDLIDITHKFRKKEN